MKLVNRATRMRVPASRCSGEADRRGLDGAGRHAVVDDVAQRARCSVTGSGVVSPVEATLPSASAWRGRLRRGGGSPTPSVPTTPQRRPRAPPVPAPVHQAVELLPLVPVTATTSSASPGRPEGGTRSRRWRPSGAGSVARRASSKPNAATPSASTRQAAARPAAPPHMQARVGGRARPGQERIAGAHLATRCAGCRVRDASAGPPVGRPQRPPARPQPLRGLASDGAWPAWSEALRSCGSALGHHLGP